jgi:phage-related protein
MTAELKPLPLQFWRSNSGREPTRDWFRELPISDRAVLGHDLKRVQFGWPLGMPLIKSLGGGLWEVRSSLPGKREGRVLFAVDEDGIVVLHGFIKKSQKTPQSDLNLARKRMKEFDDEN